MSYDVIVVGGGAAGLTAAAFLSKLGHTTLLLEKEPHCGGLVNSFQRNGFTFDGGIRALENAGVLFPMLRKLGIDLEFVKNQVSIGIENKVISVKSEVSLYDYQDLLTALYPDSGDEIKAIITDIQQITKLMDIQYGIDNPLFLDIKADRDYFIREVFPWMFKYAINVRKVTSKDQPVIAYLKKFTDNQALIDIIAQHFFTETPAYFALSYFKLYQEYNYPKGGTGAFIQALVEVIQQHGGEIQTSTAVRSIDLDGRQVGTSDGQEMEYQQLLWAADQRTLYELIDLEKLTDLSTSEWVQKERTALAGLKGNDSVLTLFLGTQLPPSYFASISAGHFFYTPCREGLTKAGSPPVGGIWDEMRAWLERFFALTTYEISIPVLRDPDLAPEGKTGLVVSTLFDYALTRDIVENGWEETFKEAVSELMLATLSKSIYPGLEKAVIINSVSTPVSMARITGNWEGAITGWSFTNHPIPAENRLVKIANAVKTPLKNVTQAGQWTYSPSGFPVSLITGKLAADHVDKALR